MKGCYPKFLYHAKHEPRVVKSAEEHESLHDAGWAESPGEAQAIAQKSEPAASPVVAEAPAPASAEAAPRRRGRRPKSQGGDES
jgi:hypothetical protein